MQIKTFYLPILPTHLPTHFIYPFYLFKVLCVLVINITILQNVENI